MGKQPQYLFDLKIILTQNVDSHKYEHHNFSEDQSGSFEFTGNCRTVKGQAKKLYLQMVILKEHDRYY